MYMQDWLTLGGYIQNSPEVSLYRIPHDIYYIDHRYHSILCIMYIIICIIYIEYNVLGNTFTDLLSYMYVY